MEMQRLNPGMMERYEIGEHRPLSAGAVQFGMGPALLGALDRQIDGANAALPPAARLGVACVQAGEDGYARRLDAQAGLYTILVRGYRGEEALRREDVCQCVLSAADPQADPEALDRLAADAGLWLGIVDADSAPALAAVARFLAARHRAGLPGLDFICAGDGEDAAECFWVGVLDRAPAEDGDFPGWLARENTASPALIDSLVCRAGAREAARQCREMNYLDDMLHLAEPHVRVTVCAAERLRARLGAKGAPGLELADAEAFRAAWTLRRRVFDAGLCLMAAPGWLNGCDTLRDCMTGERLRRFVGGAFTGEILPALDEAGLPRDAVEARVIESFARWENPLTENGLLESSRGLLRRFREGCLPVMARWADAHFEPPRHLSFALAATVMLYAGARRNPETGLYEVLRGREAQPLRDDPEALAVFATLSHDMPPESLAYAALADRELWGRDLREIDGLEARVALDIAAMQRRPDALPEED